MQEENIGKKLSDINYSRILYDPPPRIPEIKAKINKWDLIKIKSFCTTKEAISKVERQPPWCFLIDQEYFGDCRSVGHTQRKRKLPVGESQWDWNQEESSNLL